MVYDDMMKNFASPVYDSCRPFIEKIVRARPDLSDKELIAGAALEMENAAFGDVNLSVEDALTLSAAIPAPDLDTLTAHLHSLGFDTAQDILDADVLLDAPEPFRGEEKNPDAVVRVHLLRHQGELLNKEPGCIVTGLPKFDPEDETARLIVAITSPELTREAQILLEKLRLNAHRSEYEIRNGVAWLQFTVENCWKE